MAQKDQNGLALTHLLVDQSKTKTLLLMETIKAAVKVSLPNILNHSNEKMQSTTVLHMGYNISHPQKDTHHTGR